DQRLALIDGEPRSRAALFVRATQVAATLADFGVAAGDRVALAARSGAEWLATFCGIALARAIPVLVDPRLGDPDLAPTLTHAAPRLVLADPGRCIPVAAPCLTLPLQRAVRAPGDPPRVAPHAPAVIVYTSGTSGTPKGVVLSHAALA